MENIFLQRPRILIADDSEMNRAILSEMLNEKYEILEASTGAETLSVLRSQGSGLSLLLLDIVMPEGDGFHVLEEMGRSHWIEDIPVIMISSERSAQQVERAYSLGAADFIARPFDPLIVYKRVENTILLYAKQQQLVSLVAAQTYESQRQNELMIDILSHIVEFRNGESGLHVRHVQALTAFLLERLSRMEGPFCFSPAEISTLATASALHDIGKIAIAEDILNKPGRLTAEEFELIKTHTLIGASMLENLPVHQNDPLVKASREICRWHHERYDGGGYPDGLKGDAIPMIAQVVAIVDVYDALTSKRAYKEAYSHEQALQMILNGECGAFHPLLLWCLSENGDAIPRQLQMGAGVRQDTLDVTRELLRRKDVPLSQRTVQLLEWERTKNEFFAALTDELQFEFTLSPPRVILSPFGAQKLGFPEVIQDPFLSERVLAPMGAKAVYELSDLLRSTSPGQPVVTYDCQLQIGREKRWYRFMARAIWSTDEPARYTGAIGKATDIHVDRLQMAHLERMASHDSLTGLLNHASAKKRIESRLAERPQGTFALVLFDLDKFKAANDTYGHLFGDELLRQLAVRLRRSVRSGDIIARVGGDEFIIFMEYKAPLEHILQRIYSSLCGPFGDFEVSLSMGAARTSKVGTDYNDLFHAADRALYSVKRGERGRGAKYVFYDPSMDDAGDEKTALSSIWPIGADGEAMKGDTP